MLDRGLHVSGTRCGDFRNALDLLASPANALASRLATLMVTDVVPADRLAEAFARAKRPESVKVVATHANGFL